MESIGVFSESFKSLMKSISNIRGCLYGRRASPVKPSFPIVVIQSAINEDSITTIVFPYSCNLAADFPIVLRMSRFSDRRLVLKLKPSLHCNTFGMARHV